MDFCGSDVIVQNNKHDDYIINGKDSKECFKDYENGKKLTDIFTNQSNILKGVIVGKKSWGLHVKMWSDGIGDGEFRMKDIIEDFENKNIKIPESLLKDFENHIKRRIIKNKGDSSKLYFRTLINYETI